MIDAHRSKFSLTLSGNGHLWESPWTLNAASSSTRIVIDDGASCDNLLCSQMSFRGLAVLFYLNNGNTTRFRVGSQATGTTHRPLAGYRIHREPAWRTLMGDAPLSCDFIQLDIVHRITIAPKPIWRVWISLCLGASRTTGFALSIMHNVLQL